jgi:hypothetical protein
MLVEITQIEDDLAANISANVSNGDPVLLLTSGMKPPCSMASNERQAKKDARPLSQN